MLHIKIFWQLPVFIIDSLLPWFCAHLSLSFFKLLRNTTLSSTLPLIVTQSNCCISVNIHCFLSFMYGRPSPDHQRAYIWAGIRADSGWSVGSMNERRGIGPDTQVEGDCGSAKLVNACRLQFQGLLRWSFPLNSLTNLWGGYCHHYSIITLFSPYKDLRILMSKFSEFTQLIHGRAWKQS